MDTLRKTWDRTTAHLNFYRIHLLVFSFAPLLFAIVFWAAQTEPKRVSFIDSLFVCVSSLTVTGLATIDLSPLTGFQQALLFIQMCLGGPVAVSWIVVYFRKSFFRRRFGDIVIQRMRDRSARDRESVILEVPTEVLPLRRRFANLFRRKAIVTISRNGTIGSESDTGSERRRSQRVRTDMIRRMDNAPRLINPSGWISEERTTAARPSMGERVLSEPVPHKQLAFAMGDVMTSSPEAMVEDVPGDSTSDPGTSGPVKGPGASRRQPISSSPDYGRLGPESFNRYPTITAWSAETRPPMTETRTITQHDPERFPRSPTVEFVTTRPPHHPQHARRGSLAEWKEGSLEEPGLRKRSRSRSELDHRPTLSRGPGFPRSTTMHTSYTMQTARTRATMRTQDQDFGGFPMPHQIVGRIVRKWFPSVGHRLRRTVTIPRTTTLASQLGDSSAAPGVRAVPYISFDAMVGRNSLFHGLSEENMKELGGVEYRALSLLLWIIAGYHIGLQVFGFIVIAPYMQQERWRPVFESQPGYVPPLWFSAFQVVSAYTNTGTSLCDTSMVPFRTAYPMIFVMFFLILAGNTGFPIFLRLTIWIITKLVPKNSRTNETLHFILDHPRRCYIYLFPSHQTWFLLTVLVLMILTDWIAFLVLDLGTPEIEAIPVGTRIVIGLVQAAAVRAAGFVTVSLAALAPAVKVLYVTMMYVAVYPIALSVRSTNVYEEQSLGIFEGEDEESEPESSGPRGKVWGSYLAWHARKQLSFDMWWLGFALWLVCIIERGHITNVETGSWFDIFQIIFEIVSAYGTVGLSLGIPTANYSFAGALKPLSKFILIIVMIRGRHRGLPVAIDRAVLLPGLADFLPPTNSIDDEQDNRGRQSGVPLEKSPSIPNGHAAGHADTDKPRLDPVPEISSPRTQHVEVRKHSESEESTATSVV